jgi:membrane associated rhomboid family serine protease
LIPLRDDIRSSRRPFVTYALVGGCAAVFALQFLTELQDPRAADTLIRSFGMVPATLFKHPWTVFTSMFLHGGILHFLGNMLYLWIFGDNVEDALGPVLYPLAYVGTGIAGSLLHFAASPGSAIPTIGASGAISGVMGAYFVLYPRARVLTVVPVFFFIRLLYLPAWLLLGFWILFQVMNGCAAGPAGSGVAYLAHIGGFGTGVIVGLLARPKVRRPWYEIH